MSEMTIRRSGRHFGVSAGHPFYLFEGTRTACQGFIDQCARIQAELAAFEAGKAARDAAKLTALGVGPVGFRALRAGDLYAVSPDGPVREVTKADHLDSGASVIHHEASAVDRACGDMGFLLLTSGPVYGLLRHQHREEGAR